MDELLTSLKLEVGEGDDDYLTLKLNRAISAVVKARRPFGCTEEQKTEILVDYESEILDIATYLYNRKGSEGEKSHNENGINRGYESAGIPSSFLDGIVPMCGII